MKHGWNNRKEEQKGNGDRAAGLQATTKKKNRCENSARTEYKDSLKTKR
jgi:hypothetical protein